MIERLRNNNSLITLMVLLAIIIYRLIYVNEADEHLGAIGPLWFWIEPYLNSFSSFGIQIWSAVLFIVSSLAMTFILNQHKIFKRHNYLFMLLSIALLFKSGNSSFNSHIIYLLLIPFIYHQIIELSRAESIAYSNIFNLSLMMGVLVVFNHSYFLHAAFIFLFILLVIQFNLRIILLYIAGLFLIYYTIFMLNYLLEMQKDLDLYWNRTVIEITAFHLDYFQLSVLLFLSLFIVAAIFHLQGLYARLIILKRRFHLANYLLLISGVIACLLVKQWNWIMFLYIAYPVTVIINDWINRIERPWIKETIGLALIACLFI